MATVSASSIRLSDPAGGRADAAWGLPFGTVVLPLIVARPALENALGLVRVSVGPASLSLGFLFNILMVILAGVLAGYALLVDRRRQRHVLLIGVIWGPFLFAAAIAAVRSPVPVDAIQVLFNYLTYAAVSFIALTYGPALSRQALTMIVAASGAVPAIYGVLQAVAGTGGDRIASTFSHPNVLAFFLLIYVSFLFHAQLSYYSRSPGARITIWVLIAVALVAVLLTGTRSAYIAIFLFLFVYSMFRKPMLLLPIMALPVMALMIPEVSSRINDAISGSSPASYEYMVSVMRGDVADSRVVSMNSSDWRQYLWKSAIPWIENKPFFGYGLASFPVYILDFFPLAEERGAAHNIYIQMAFEGGGLLLISFIMVMLLTVLTGIRFYKNKFFDFLFITICIISYSLVSFSDNMLHYLSINIMMWLIVFFVIGINDKNRSSGLG